MLCKLSLKKRKEHQKKMSCTRRRLVSDDIVLIESFVCFCVFLLSNDCRLRLARLPEVRQPPRAGVQTMRAVQNGAVLFCGLPASALEQWTQEGVQGHDTRRMNGLRTDYCIIRVH